MRDKGRDMRLLQLLPPVLLVILMQYFSQGTVAAHRPASIAKPGCIDKCGNVSIPYPFGVGAGCYFDEGFAVTCNGSFSPPRPYLSSTGLELMGVSLAGYVRVQNPVISSNCGNRPSVAGVNLSGSPFVYSSTYNRFTAMGCDNNAMLLDQKRRSAGCQSVCKQQTKRKGYYGYNYCQTAISAYINSFTVNMTRLSEFHNASDCRLAFMVDKDWFENEQETVQDYLLRRQTEVPAVFWWASSWAARWGVTYREYCDMESEDSSPNFCSDDGYCWKQIGKNALCICGSLPEISPMNLSYVTGKCQEDLHKCKLQKFDGCSLSCIHKLDPDNYSSCLADDYWPPWERKESSKGSRVKIILIGCGSSLGLLLLLGGPSLLYKMLKQRTAIKLKEKYFRRNGGLLLQRQVSRKANNMEPTKTFTSKELEQATGNFNSNRILGQGGQGKVYKGMLADGSIVAIKKSSVDDPGKVEQFINEVVILSQINHRNVVKLLGCCLETEVPLLVYEFIPNGTLFQHLHDENEEFPITWQMRMRIAMQVVDALSYMHSEAPLPIYHRDIKSSNILLDEKYRAKVSDFGLSRSVAIDQTHLTTNVQGTFGYLDPEYFRSHQFTEKSDVYSFGVVLVELLTSERPINNSRSEHEMGLVNYFLLRMKEKRLFDILDARVRNEGSEEATMAVAKLAKRCVSMIGRKRPTMREVAMELQWIRASQGVPDIEQQCFDKIDKGDITEPWPSASSSSTLANDPTLSP